MMTEEMMKQMPHMMSQAGHMMSKPMATGAMMAGAGFAAGKGLLGGALLRNPLTLLAVGAAGGIAAGRPLRGAGHGAHPAQRRAQRKRLARRALR